MNRLSEIKARLDAATPGKWEVEYLGPSEEELNVVAGVSTNGKSIIQTDAGYYPPLQPDANFIAHARDDIPWLIEQIEIATEALEPAIQYLETFVNLEEDEPEAQMLKSFKAALAKIKGGEKFALDVKRAEKLAHPSALEEDK